MEVRAPNAPSELANNILSWLGICGGWYLPLALGVCLGPLPCHFCPLQQRTTSRGAEGRGEGGSQRSSEPGDCSSYFYGLYRFPACRPPGQSAKILQNAPSQLVFREKYPDSLILYYSGTSGFLILFSFLLLPAKYNLFSGTFDFWEAASFSNVTIFLV